MMDPTAASILPLAPSQHEAALEVICRAFRSDPLLSFLTPRPAAQERLLRWFARTGLDHGARQGEVYATPGVRAAAVWFAPGRPHMTAGALLWAARWLPLTVGWGCCRRFLAFVNFADRRHRALITGDHWYLFILTVDPAHQGQGLGSALLEPVLARADAQGLPVYLETTNPRAVPFYRKHGFTVAHHAGPAAATPLFWALSRRPRS